MVLNTYKNLLLLGVLGFGTIAVFGEELFGFVFGQAWIEAGTFATLISPWLLFNFVGSPLTMIFSVLEKQRQMFFWIGSMFVARVLSIVIGLYIYGDVFHTIVLFSASGTVFYFFMNMYLVCVLSKVRLWEFIRTTFGLPLLIVIGLVLLRVLIYML
jgi:O-antigen/teichoic acid export membrane protein